MRKLVASGTKDDYELIRNEAEKPPKEREAILSTKKGFKKAKRYHIDQSLATKKLSEFRSTGAYFNPYKKGGVYYGFVQALVSLGVNKKHPFSKVKKEMRSILSSLGEWNAFENKKLGNDYTAHDVNGRIMETARILQRICGWNPYGEKLRQMCSCINIYRDSNNLPVYELRTGFASYNDVEPIYERKRRSRA